MGELFGTDGIRGQANKHPITAETALALGRAAASHFAARTDEPKIVVGKDTRISGDMLEHAIASGICSMGADALLAGVLPTPGIAFVTAALKADAGIVISASHNPFTDNGIKILDQNGFKLPDEVEDKIEKILLQGDTASLCENIGKTGRVHLIDDAGDRYVEFLKKTLPQGFCLSGMKIVLDCSNGAAFQVAPRVFSELGAEIEVLSDEPDGLNINENCGSQHTEALRKAVADTGAHIGLAFDGDADRLVCSDENGEEVRGDRIMFVCAKHLKEIGRLKNNLLVTTVMSNIGLRLGLEKLGIEHAAAKVGDRYVLEMMKEKGACLGGEDSGHIICLDRHTTGDGILAALLLISAIKAEKKPLSELANRMDLFPQKLVNVPVREKPPVEDLAGVMAEIREAEKVLGDRGRVLVRYSGTALKCRVMVEAPTMEETESLCEKIAAAVQTAIGA